MVKGSNFPLTLNFHEHSRFSVPSQTQESFFLVFRESPDSLSQVKAQTDLAIKFWVTWASKPLSQAPVDTFATVGPGDVKPKIEKVVPACTGHEFAFTRYF